MKANELRQKYLDFFEEKGHIIIPSASLVPKNDPTVLFTTAGMHPLVPYIMGEKHPEGKRLVNSQKCFRTSDIEEVGDRVHHTFFEMLGNWSFGDYFKNEAIEYSWEFLTDDKWLGLDRNKLAISIFKGDDDAPYDEVSHNKWLSLGIPEERIAKLGKKDNWWGPAAETGPCGPDTEMFYWSGQGKAPKRFDSEDGRWVEIWNDVFMEYDKDKDGKYNPLEQKNVDTGMGLERTLAVLNGLDDNYKTDLFLPLIEKIDDLSSKMYEGHDNEFRIIADHIKAAIFAITDGVSPSNKQAGYIVRRLVRRAVIKAYMIGIKKSFTSKMVSIVSEIYRGVYEIDERKVRTELDAEEKRFRETLNQGLKAFEKAIKDNKGLDAKETFNLYQTYGFPIEMTKELAEDRGFKIDEKGFQEELKKHQELSRGSSSGMFKGGLADDSEATIKYHTAAHLLMDAMQDILGEHIHQKGSNITAERLRLDFSHPEKLSDEEKKRIEDWVNDKIKKNLKVYLDECDIKTAKKKGAEGDFDERYEDMVKVYSIGGDIDSKNTISKEICGGPHVKNTRELGHFRIKNETSSSRGVRRIKAVLE